MIGLTGKENKIIQLLHRNFEGEGGVPNKTNVLNFLTTKIALPQETSQNLYTLWWLNYQEDGDYSDIEVNRDPKPIITILKDIHSGKLVEEDIPSHDFSAGPQPMIAYQDVYSAIIQAASIATKIFYRATGDPGTCRLQQVYCHCLGIVGKALR